MALSDKQLGVFKGMAFAMTVSVLTIILATYLDPFSYTLIVNAQGRIEILGLSVILPTLCLVASIGRLAKFRFFSPDDIDGSALTKGSENASLLQSLLQNTVEQLVIAISVYTAWCFLMPVSWLSAIPLCSVLFALGRILFFKGYKSGAASRAFGFALTFYSTVVLLLVLIIYQVCVVVS
ncbi:MAPEG family protein [Moritella sp. 5]|uniref:MAPEG family protein n=1 Tax=Moritella sp. 5 TaxID=2746231 RepID=UPI001BAD4323|nr:MAPEG family protein [Moritella sp. 5]